MASSNDSPYNFSFELPVNLSTHPYTVIYKKGVKGLCSHLSSSLATFNGYIQNVKGLRCMFVSKISLKKGHVMFTFVIDNTEELEQFYKLSKENVLSQTLTEYSEKYSWQVHAGLNMGTTLRFRMEMDEATYNHAKEVLKSEPKLEEKCKDETQWKSDSSWRSDVAPPLQQYPQLSAIKITVQSEDDVVKKEMVIMGPKFDPGKTATSIWVMLHTVKIPECVDAIKMTRSSSSPRLWRAEFAIPMTTPTDDLECWFSAEVCSTSTWLRSKTYEVVGSTMRYKISNNIIQRVFFNKPVYVDQLAEQYADIVINCSALLPVRDCVMQIESLCGDFNLNKDNARFVLSYVLKAAVEKASNQQLLIFVILGIFFKKIVEVGDHILTDKVKHNILTSLKCFRSSDLTQSCSTFMINVAIDLCKATYGIKYSFLTFVLVTYPFFDAKQLSEKVRETLRREEPIVPNDIGQKTESDILYLFKTMFDKSSDSNTKTLLSLLLRHTPTKLAVNVYIALKQKEQTDSSKQTDVYSMTVDCVIGSIQSFFKTTKNTCVELYELWQIVKSCSELMDPTLSDFENAVLQRIVKADRREMETIKSIVVHDEVFQSRSQQSEVVKTLMTAKNSALHLHAFQIATASKFKEACLNVDPKYFSVCFENAFCQFKLGSDLEQRLKDVYTYLSKALELPIIKQCEALRENINTAAVDFLRHCDLKVLFRRTKDLENITEKNPYIGDLFRHHMQKLLQQRRIDNYFELLMNLCGTAQELRVNSKVTADIVCTILDLCVPSVETSVPCCFLEIIKHYDLWKTVFKASGKDVFRVRQSVSYFWATNCIKNMIKLIQSSEIQYGYFQELTKIKSREEVIDILVIHFNETKLELSRQWNRIDECFQSEINTMISSISVLNTLQNEISRKHMPSGVKQMADDLEKLREDIQKGKVTAKQLQQKTDACIDMPKLTNVCSFLLDYVNSKIFWTACKDKIEEVFDKERVKLKEDIVNDAIESIYSLFEESKPEQDETDFGVSETFLLLQILTDDGIREYKHAWNTLIREHEKDVSFALQLLRGTNVEDEVKYAENILREPIPNEMKNTLCQLKNIHIYEYTVDAVKQSLSVFDAKLDKSDELLKAIMDFDKIRETSSENCPFSLVVSTLKLVDKMSKELVKETIDILYALSESSLLLDFLKQIVDEDIRNLIDAVEDRSEQYVQESTVSALIEVKSFLQGAVVKSLKGMHASEFLLSINKQTQSLSCKASKLIPAKIHECMSSLHNLKSLYGNVANRGEITAETIANIVLKGRLKFVLNRGGECDFYASYRHVSRKEKQLKSNLIDLRSRALLLMNTRTKAHDSKINSDALEKFVSYMDLSIEIAELCKELHQSGNIEFLTYSTKTDCQGLGPLREQLLEKKQEWIRAIQMLRKEFYLLNFIHGPEIHLLYSFFEKKIGLENVVTILRFIHPEITVSHLAEEYKRLKAMESTWSNEVMLKCFGKVLHFGYKDKNPVQRQFHLNVTSKRVTDVVQNKRLFVAALDENSNQVVKTLLALYHNTTQTLPEPHQVLICTRETTWNELELLLSRCFGSYVFTNTKELFCISNIEMLTNELQFRLVEKLKTTCTEDNYLLSMICRGSSKHPFLDEFGSFISRSLAPLSDEILRQAFQNECPDVVTYTSNNPGLGKSNMIKTNAFLSKRCLTKIHISGPLHKESIIERLSTANIKESHAVHIDIGSVDNPVELDTFIFELIILRYVTAGFKATSLETNVIYIEIANTINESLRNSLNTVMSFKREVLGWKDYSDFIVSAEINSPVQVVCHYLNCLDNNTLDKKDLYFSGNNCETSLDPSVCRKLMRKHFGGDSGMSFSVVNTFLQVLADQLKKMACSSYFRVSRVSEMVGHKTVPSVRSTLLKALAEASNEFASRSIKSCRSTQVSTVAASEESIQEQSVRDLKQVKLADQNSGMVRWEDSNHLIYVFHNQNIQTLSPLYREVGDVPEHIKSLFESQIKRPLQNFKHMDQSSLQNMLQKVARTDPKPLSVDIVNKLNAEYALTPDNLLKMVLIMLRIKAHIPVIVMGETGCGKTSLIRYLATVSDVDFDVLSIHAGIEENEITDKLWKQNEAALSSPLREKCLLLDEINTSEQIGVMNDAICSGTCLGKLLAPNLIVMGACNPYRLRTESAISTAGLKGKIQTDELSKLVYRVLPLPERMVDYVWDFGSLSDEDEVIYIRRMVEDVFHSNSTLDLLQNLLSESQKFVRKAEDVSYCVSLRDVQRCKTLIKWFIKILPRKDSPYSCFVEQKSIILALAICYHSRFSSNKLRESYRKELGRIFAIHRMESYDEKQIHKVIVEEQKDILDRMELPAGTAKNTALRENVFVILVCLLNQIPVFLVGKPGCSKSLSMQVIRSNLRGKDSKNDFFKSLPQLYCVAFQGSESSTSDGIIKVFEKATRYQESNNEDEVLSVVILDEIGLAEISKFNPLKVLHSLLEPDGRPQPDVAVVGISNWSLDASKMNRGIHLSRPDMDEEELYQTGLSISESFLETKYEKKSRFSSPCITLVSGDLNGVLRDIAQSYLKYTEVLRFKNFHGLRDFYSLVKFVSKQLLEDDEGNVSLVGSGKESLVLEGLQRNFGGLPTESATLLKMFQIQVQDVSHHATNVLKLVKANVDDKMARHLMCITSGGSVLSLIEKVLTESHRDERVVIFGSHFEEDQTADYNYRILSRIILCMEQGFVLILRDLDNVYGSLYDMLNQNYTMIGKKKHCRVALGHYSNPICQVHDDFRCIVLVDESDVDFTDPPFLNRFEKQYINCTDIICSEERTMISKLEHWVDQLCSIENCHFDANDCFPIYSLDMIPSLAMKMYRDVSLKDAIESDKILELSKTSLFYIAQPDAIFRVAKSTNQTFREQAEQIKEDYFNLPIHSGIWHFIDHQTAHVCVRDKGIMTVVLTNSSIHVRDNQKNDQYQVQVEKLGAFKSEKQLSIRIQHFWTESSAKILFLHCSVAEDERHIPLAKTTVENVRQDALKENPDLSKHVYMILHMDRRRAETKAVSPINFLSGWEIVTLDAIEEPSIPLFKLCRLSLYDTVSRKRPLTKFITEQLFWCFTRIKYQRHGRTIDSILMIIEKIKRSERLLKVLEELICKWVESESNSLYGSNWQEVIATDAKALNENASFVLALEQKISSVISIPLSKLLYRLENANALATYFFEDKCLSQRQRLLENLIRDQTSFTLTDTPAESGPECYLCTAADLVLKMPVSKVIFDKIEETRDDFMESFLFVKGNLDLEEDDIVPKEVMEELFAQHESMVNEHIPDVRVYMYDNICDDYLHDFSNFISFATSSQIREEKRVEIVKWTLMQKVQLLTDSPIELMVKLHATYWIFSSVLNAEHQLFETCAEIFNVEENFSTFLTSQDTAETGFGLESKLDIDNNKIFAIMSTDMEETSICNTFVDKVQLDGCADDAEKEVYSTCESLRPEATQPEVIYSRASSCSSKKLIESIPQQDIERLEITSLNEITPMASNREKSDRSDDYSESEIEKLEEESLMLSKKYIDTAETVLAVQKNKSNGAALSEGDTDEIDASKMLVQNLSLKLLPSETCLAMFGTYEDWNVRVSIVLTLASLISSEPQAFHALRFCRDLVSALYLQLNYEKNHSVVRLGNILYLNKAQNLDSSECFDCVCDILFTETKPAANTVLSVLAAYLNRCQAANRDSQVMIHLLRLLEDQIIPDVDFVALKPPMHLALNLEILEFNNTIYHELLSASNVDLKERPFLFALDATLKAFKGTSKMDSQLSVLIVDILESFFTEAEHDLENDKAILLSAHRVIDSNDYGLKFLTAISFWKSFAKLFINLLRDDCTDCSEYISLLPALQAILTSTVNCKASLSLKQYLLKEYGKGMLPWKLCKSFEIMKDTFEIFKIVDATEDYNVLCIEGCPLIVHAPNVFKTVTEAVSEKDADTQETLIKGILKASDEKIFMLALHGVCQSRFYISRSYKQLDDTSNQLAKKIVVMAKNENIDPVNLYFLSCLLGVHVFSEPVLELNEESSEEETVIAVFCTSLFALVLSSNQQLKCNQLSVLAKCLIHPAESKANLLMSMKELFDLNATESDLVEQFVSCSCGNRLGFREDKHETVLHCPICRKEIHEELHDPTINSANAENVCERIRIIRKHESCVSLHPVTIKLINLFVNACLLGSLALNISKVKDLEPVIDISEIDDIPTTLFIKVKSCFGALMNLLDMGYRDTFIFLQACLLNLRSLICDDKRSYDTPEEILLWSRDLEKQIKMLLFDRHGTVQNTVRLQTEVTKLGDATELCVNESDNIDICLERRDQLLPSLFRMQGQPSRSTLEYNVDVLASDNDHPYPFLAFVLKILPQLEITEHLLPLVQWHLTTVTHTGYRTKRLECLEMSVKDYLGRDKKNSPVRKLLEKRFKNLQDAWVSLMKANGLLQTNIKRLTFASKMKDCLLLDCNSPIYRLINELVGIQNNFLDNALQISVRNKCQALKCLSRTCGISAIPSGIVSDVKLSDIVSYNWDDTLLQFAHADLRYGCGQRIQFEFEAIEKTLALDLVVGKCYLLLDTNLPSVVFIDEFYATMVKEVSMLIPQKQLPSDIARKMKEKGEESTGLTVELITHMGILMALAKKARGDPEQPLIEYVEMWKNVLTCPFPVGVLPAPEESVKLCHLVALYGLLEELNAEPISNLTDEYRVPLSDDIQEQLNDVLNSNRKKAEMILQATKRFTYRCLYEGDVDSSRPLTEYMEDKSFWPLDQAGVLETSRVDEMVRPLDLIPADLRVHHVYEMMSLMEEKLKELTEKDNRLTQITSSFKLRSNAKQPDRKRKIIKQRRI